MATELADGVWQFNLRGVNSYLVEDDVPVLVDAGPPWDEDALRRNLDEVGISVGDVGRILLTHYDLDHVGTLAALAPDLETTVRAGAFDADILTNRRAPPLLNHKGAFQRLTSLVTTHPDLTVGTVQDTEEIGTFTAYHTPGHTPGHVAYVSEELGVGVLGDLVTESDGALKASPRALSYDRSVVHDSIIRLSKQASAFDVACMGHGTPITAGGSDALAALARELEN